MVPSPQKILAQQATNPHFPFVLGRSPWWVPVSKPMDKRQKLTFAEALKDFLRHVSFHCYEKLVEPNRMVHERFFWLLFHIAALTVLITFLYRTRSIEGQLLTTTVYDPLYPVEKVPFPAISLCSINRISNASAMRYAEQLNTKDPEKRGTEFFYEQIHMLSMNYFSLEEIDDFYKASEFQRFLDLYDTTDAEMFYNTRSRMQMLTPKCKDILMQCQLFGDEIDCSEIFKVTLTSHGFCCTFNSDGEFSQERPSSRSMFGAGNGLVVLLKALTDDYFYKFYMDHEFLVSTYASSNYASVISGAVQERFFRKESSSFLSIKPIVINTVDAARFVSPRARNCLFENERPREFGKSYTFNKCITRCRANSISILCQCVMFTTPFEYLTSYKDFVYCTLQHTECLKRYEFKWLNVITSRANLLPDLPREREDALYCPECYPPCSETQYKVRLVDYPLNAFNMRTMPQGIVANDTDVALLHAFFAEPYGQYYEQILTNSWFEIFSKIGNICSIITGFSLIGICEIIFFLIKQLLKVYRDEALSDRKQKFQPKEPLIILP